MTNALHEFAALSLWVTWRSEERGGRLTKVPYSPTINGRASSTDPSTWTTRAIVEHAVEQDGYDGIGLVLAGIDEARHLGGIDLDSCIDDEGNVAPWARDIVELVASYTEISPSGHGFKVFFTHDPRETLAEGMRWRSAVRQPALNGGKDHGVEFYVHGRYFTVTDKTFENFDTFRHVGLDTLLEVQAKMEVFAGKPKAANDRPRRHDNDQQRLFDAIAHIPNADLHWNDWTRIGMAIFSETNGSAAGYAAFLGWSAKSAKFNPHACDDRWQHWRTSPPDRLTAGTIFHEAKAGGWRGPRQTKSNGAAIENAADVEDAKAIAWPEPEPLSSDTERHPYPIEALPDLVRHAVEEVQLFVQAPDEMVAASAISALAIATQHLIDVRRANGLQGPTGLNFLTIADSGDRKTTLDRFFTRPIYEYERQERETGKATEADHTARMAVWEAKKKAAIAGLESAAMAGKAKDDKAKDDKAKDDKAKGGKTLEGYQTDLADLEKNKPTLPRIPRIIYADATQEKLLRCLATGWPSAAIVSSEGGAVFGAHAMGRDAVMRTLGALNVLWDGGTLQVDRVSGGSFVVRGARMSINIQVQAAVLRDFMEGTKGLARGSGFLARFLIAAPETRQGTRMFQDAPATWPALDDFNARIAELLAAPANTNDDGTLAPTVLDFSHEAKAAWIECHDKIEKAIGPIGEFVDVRDVAAKAADNIARMAALFHFLNERNGYGHIGPNAVRSAAAVVIWHLYQAKHFLGPLSSSPEEARAAALDGWLRDHCRREGVSTASTRTIQQFGPVRARKALDEALAALVEGGRAKIIAEGKKRQVAVNPALLEATP
jgi:Protein of unknown function (DUF3987)/Primase C terminal 2 (PriCT-2)